MNILDFQTPANMLDSGKIPVAVLGDSGEVFYEIALRMVTCIQENNAKGLPTVMICPVGPVGQYPIFVRLVRERNLDLSKCVFINMDEYLGADLQWVQTSDPLSFRGFMERNVYSQIPQHLNVKPENRIFPDPNNPGHIMDVIDTYGHVDLCVGGIGINGHLAFNESEDVDAQEFAIRCTRVIALSKETRTANAIGDKGGAIDAMPTHAVTIGMREILRSKQIVLGVFRDWHRAVLRQAIFDVPSGHFPVTLLQDHPNSIILSNANAARVPF